MHKRRLCKYAVVIVLALASCEPVRHIYLGKNPALYDSSDVLITRVNRLSVVEFFEYKTINHVAGQMGSKHKTESLGIFSTGELASNYNWEGEFLLLDERDTSFVKYHSSINQDDKYDYGAFSAAKILGQTRTPTTDQFLTVSGNIVFHNDSATFLFSNMKTSSVQKMNGLVLMQNEKLIFKRLDSSYSNNNLLENKPYGYGIFSGEILLAAIDVVNKPALVYFNKTTDNKKRKAIAGFMCIVTGNIKIVKRSSTFWKM